MFRLRALAVSDAARTTSPRNIDWQTGTLRDHPRTLTHPRQIVDISPNSFVSWFCLALTYRLPGTPLCGPLARCTRTHSFKLSHTNIYSHQHTHTQTHTHTHTHTHTEMYIIYYIIYKSVARARVQGLVQLEEDRVAIVDDRGLVTIRPGNGCLVEHSVVRSHAQILGCMGCIGCIHK